ncbi:Protein of unknown function (DUF732) [Prauserella aidingensis]|uniref:DUF732 domain-containing protein n=1 Tax=Prauserella aidingensis TaxID=387890 RepID=UPI0020A44B5D|nr:DUF732 domain-containing protein [Prauserella aidingensis]MCP2255438.1 Protein of unknown function (DUF732) [Prauserella aidingensis]
MRRCGLVLTVLLAPVAGCATGGSTEPASGPAAPITVDAAPAGGPLPGGPLPGGPLPGGPFLGDAPHPRPSFGATADYLATLTTAGLRPRSSTTREQDAAHTADTTGEEIRSWSADTWVDHGIAACGRLHDADGDVAAVSRAIRRSLPTAGGYGRADLTTAERSTLIVTAAAEELCPDITAQ